MRNFLLTFCLFLFMISSCSEEEVSPKAEAQQPVTKTLKIAIPQHEQEVAKEVSGLTRFKVANLAIPAGGLPDAKRFYTDGLLRASTAYNPKGITVVKRNGTDMIRYYINPTAAPEYLTGREYPYHHRAEFTRFPWRISHPLGTEEWLGFSYIFPTEAEGFTQARTPISIYQNYASSPDVPNRNSPVLLLEIAYPGQLNSSSDPYRQTPLGGEIMIANQVLGYRYVAQGVRVTPGTRLDIVMQIVYGYGKEGLFNVWINGQLHTFPGNGTLPAGNAGSTLWPDLPLGGNSKIGLYHHQFKYDNLVLANAKVGHTEMEMFMTDWNDVIRTPADWDYKNSNAYGAVDTSGYK